ncbi:MAG TPA: response regulator transcription factor [Anaerolineales bacterium]|nr:response regulator transcription factor [Anaerolineales bacterium]HNC88989.1 response regulator transcription factor [Anaerolineales bacterium]
MPDDKNMISIILADDHQMARQGIRSILEKAPDFEIVGEAKDGDEVRRLVAALRPQILLLDLKMPNLSPAELEKWVRINYPETNTLVLTGHDRDVYLANMMDAGVSGYLDKKLRAGQLISAIRRAARGEIFFDEEQIERARRWREEVGNKWASLSEREKEILQKLTEGAENLAIAEMLCITTNTVEKHLTNIYKKLGVKSRLEAAIWWLEKSGDFRN